MIAPKLPSLIYLVLALPAPRRHGSVSSTSFNDWHDQCAVQGPGENFWQVFGSLPRSWFLFILTVPSPSLGLAVTMVSRSLSSTFGLLLSFSLFLSTRPTAAQQTNVARILIYSATADFRHDSIPTAVAALVQIGPRSNIAFDHTEDKTWFTDSTLAQYDALLFLSNTGEGEHLCSLDCVDDGVHCVWDSIGRHREDCVTKVLGSRRKLCRHPCRVGRTAKHYLVSGRSR